jgi:hypothetical protein
MFPATKTNNNTQPRLRPVLATGARPGTGPARRLPPGGVVALIGALIVGAIVAGLLVVRAGQNSTTPAPTPAEAVHVIYQARTSTDGAIVLPGNVTDEFRRIGQANGRLLLTRIDAGVSSSTVWDLTPRLEGSDREVKDSSRRAQTIDASIATLVRTMNTTTASTGGRSLYRGLLATAFSPSTPVFVVANPMDTTDPLDARKLAFDVPVADVVKTVTDAKETFDLHGNPVTFIPVTTAGAQAQLRAAQDDYLFSLWSQLLLANKAGHVTVLPIGAAASNGGQQPVPVGPETPTVALPDLPGTPVLPDPNPPVGKEVCELNSSSYFIPDTAQLIDPEGTRKDLAGCVQQAKSIAGATISLDAWVAYYGPLGPDGKPAVNSKNAIQLSQARVEAIAKLLASMGIPEQTIVSRVGHGNADQPDPQNPASPRNRVCRITINKP